jgi:DNA topoisomerase-1
MAKNLVIVESPAKARTLGKYLGRNYTVKASVGHVVDLPKSKLGVDIERDFEPEYAVIHGKGKVIEDLKKAAKDKENIYLAPDPDREGEAIAWHIAERLGRKKNVHRVLFNEITKKAVQEAIKNPLKLDQNKFEAQVARRVLDRLVGYQLSPLLWKKVRRGLSAGRVQSVAVRIITEREREIRAFVKEEYWTISAELEDREGTTAPVAFSANLFELAGKRLDHKTFRLENEAAAKGVVDHLDGAEWVVAKIEKRDRKRNPTPPFITSKLQQEASRKLGYQPSRTMRIAQKLYEGVELGDEGAVGLITYMRTDSTRLSNDALDAVRGYIANRYGADYVPEKPNVYRSKKSAQDAHEAIRPTSIDWDPERVAPYLSKEELNLYTLIWNRFVACQMTPARLEQTTVDISAKDATFRATGQVVKFDGFIRVYTEGQDEANTDDDEKTLPALTEGDKLALLDLTKDQHFTQPPPRFTQATLIKELEEKGIGRPSTYASIMQTILGKEYVQEDEQRRLYPTELGMLVTDLLVDSFPDILNVEFTAGMEETLDGIEEGTQKRVHALQRFYVPFSKDLEKAETEMRNVKAEERPTDIKCDQCGDQMVIRWGRKGEFLACRRYPECKNTKNFTRNDETGEIEVAKAETTDEVCEKCGKPMLVRFGRYGKFLGCSGYPECKTILPMVKPKSLGIKCPDCGEGEILEKRSRRGKIFYSCNRYPKCTFASWDMPIAQPCPTCNAPFVVEKTTKRAGTVRRCIKEGCTYVETVGEPAGETGT